jgi:isocitrate dehydrogenase kinase/phosphatase
MTNLANCNNISEKMFNSLYDRLMEKASQENESLYQQALRTAKTKKQKNNCSGQYIGRWQTLLNKWCEAKIANTYIFQCLSLGYVEECFLN